MTIAPKPESRPWIALFDLDGTLTWHDTLMEFLASFLRHRPGRLWRLWRLPFALIGYAFHRDRGELKSRFIRMFMGGERRPVVDAYADSYVGSLMSRRRFRPAALAALEAHRAAGDRLILLSASPDLYVPRIGRLLGFERTVCTEICWREDRLDGSLLTANRRGTEKQRCLEWLRTQYPALPVVAYGNSAADLDHMRHADKALLVNGSASARRRAADLGIPSADWN